MKVMLLAWEAPEDFALRDKQDDAFKNYMGQWYAFGDSLREAGVYVAGAALEQPATATVISVRNGVRNVEDGPFPDTKEQLGGFCLIDAPDMETAVAWAEKCPAHINGYVDARPVPDFEAGDDQ